jgi:transcriptional regulator with XRE-family HTH domain
MTLFERVKETAKLKGFALSEVSRRAEIGEKSIYTWKPSKSFPEGIEPKRETLEKVADVLGVSVDYLLGNSDDMHGSSAADMPLDLEAVLAKLGPSVQFQGRELTDEQKLKLYEMAKVMFGE